MRAFRVRRQLVQEHWDSRWARLSKHVNCARGELAISARLDQFSSEARRLLAAAAPLLLLRRTASASHITALGEFLAASEIRGSPLSLILDYLFLPGTRNPNASWSPAFGFLAENTPATSLLSRPPLSSFCYSSRVFVTHVK